MALSAARARQGACAASVGAVEPHRGTGLAEWPWRCPCSCPCPFPVRARRQLRPQPCLPLPRLRSQLLQHGKAESSLARSRRPRAEFKAPRCHKHLLMVSPRHARRLDKFPLSHWVVGHASASRPRLDSSCGLFQREFGLHPWEKTGRGCSGADLALLAGVAGVTPGIGTAAFPAAQLVLWRDGGWWSHFPSVGAGS